MTNTNNKRTSKIFGLIVEVNAGQVTNTPFEIETEYTRSFDIARKFAAKALEKDANAIVITNIENEAVKKVTYNSGKILDYASAVFEDEEIAKAEFTTNYNSDFSLVPFMLYAYNGQFWAHDKDEYITDYVYDESPLKLTKINMRAFLVTSAHNLTGYEILAIHGEARKEITKYAIIDNVSLEKCVITD